MKKAIPEATQRFHEAHQEAISALNSGIVTLVDGKFQLAIDPNELAASSHDIHYLTTKLTNLINSFPRQN